ncbi:hypothetical protein ACHAPZ_009760 [Fusarium culmorum]
MSRWLIAHGRTGEATKILACIEDKPTTSPVVTAQLHEIQYSVDYERSHTIKWKDILLRRNKDTSDTKTLRRLLLGANTQLMQQFGGINIMSYYMPTVLINSVGLTERMARLLSACNAVSYLMFSSAAILLVERWGRRGLMLLSTTGQLLITNFIVVEITPIGIQNLGWRFWIVWTVTNALFLPAIYFFYPETANRKLEDMDAYFRENPSIIVVNDKDVIIAKRPEKYIEQDQEDIRREGVEVRKVGEKVL